MARHVDCRNTHPFEHAAFVGCLKPQTHHAAIAFCLSVRSTNPLGQHLLRPVAPLVLEDHLHEARDVGGGLRLVVAAEEGVGVEQTLRRRTWRYASTIGERLGRPVRRHEQVRAFGAGEKAWRTSAVARRRVRRRCASSRGRAASEDGGAARRRGRERGGRHADLRVGAERAQPADRGTASSSHSPSARLASIRAASAARGAGRRCAGRRRGPSGTKGAAATTTPSAPRTGPSGASTCRSSTSVGSTTTRSSARAGLPCASRWRSRRGADVLAAARVDVAVRLPRHPPPAARRPRARGISRRHTPSHPAGRRRHPSRGRGACQGVVGHVPVLVGGVHRHRPQPGLTLQLLDEEGVAAAACVVGKTPSRRSRVTLSRQTSKIRRDPAPSSTIGRRSP